MRLVLSEAFGLVLAGILIGTAVALALARILSSLLHGVAPHDPATFLLLPPVLPRSDSRPPGCRRGVPDVWIPTVSYRRNEPRVGLGGEHSMGKAP